MISGMFSIKSLFLCSLDSWKKFLCEETPASIHAVVTICSAVIAAAWSRRELLVTVDSCAPLPAIYIPREMIFCEK